MKHRVQAPKRAGRKDREYKILLRLVEHYILTGKPVGSLTLQELGFTDISSATIRNYFVSLEQEGFLTQQHTSGGRLPQPKAFAAYAAACYEECDLTEEIPPIPESATADNIISLLQQSAHILSQQTSLAVAISAPRFDHDAITAIHFVFVDINRALAVILTEFGLVYTHVIPTSFQLSRQILQEAEIFAKARLFHESSSCPASEHVLFLYKEAVASYVVNHSSVSTADIWKVGFSELLRPASFDEPNSLTSTLSLFENTDILRTFMRKSMQAKQLQFWIADDIAPFVVGDPHCSCIAIPYFAGGRAVGAITTVGSMKLFYKKIFPLLHETALQCSAMLTHCFQHHRISYRTEKTRHAFLQEPDQIALAFQTSSPKVSI